MFLVLSTVINAATFGGLTHSLVGSNRSNAILLWWFLLEKVPRDLFHSVYFEYEENSTHDRLLSLNYAFCHIKRLIKTCEPVYTN